MPSIEEALIQRIAEKKRLRPVLGDDVDIRVLQINVALLSLSPGTGDLLFFGGKRVGEAYARRLGKKGSLEEGIGIYSDYLKGNKIAMLELARCDEKGAVVRGRECAYSHGLPNIGRCICFFEAGFISGFLSAFTGRRVITREVKCPANGDEYCEFKITVSSLENRFEEAFKF